MEWYVGQACALPPFENEWGAYLTEKKERSFVQMCSWANYELAYLDRFIDILIQSNLSYPASLYPELSIIRTQSCRDF